MSWFSKSKYYVMFLLLVLISNRLPDKVKTATIAGKDVSDDKIDEILWEFMGKWDEIGIGHDNSQFESTMTDIFRLFTAIDSRKLKETLFRFRARFGFITRALREEAHSKHMNSTKMKTAV